MCARRLIPARAGNTIIRSEMPLSSSAHPRSRGEHRLARCDHPLDTGSSPLARGTRMRLSWGYGGRRLIPARAGNTSREYSTFSFVPAHPRSRGEHVLTIRQLLPAPGSSPLARGTLDGVEGEQVAARLIPARAGNTRFRGSYPLSRPAHPRSRGEH